MVRDLLSMRPGLFSYPLLAGSPRPGRGPKHSISCVRTRRQADPSRIPDNKSANSDRDSSRVALIGRAALLACRWIAGHATATVQAGITDIFLIPVGRGRGRHNAACKACGNHHPDDQAGDVTDWILQFRTPLDVHRRHRELRTSINQAHRETNASFFETAARGGTALARQCFFQRQTHCVRRYLGEQHHVGLVAIPAATVWPHQRNDTSDADSVKGYQTLSNAGKKTNHLDAKSRELIAVAVAVSLRCDGAPSHSINNAKLRTKTIVDAARSASEQEFLAIASERKVGYVMHSDRFGTLLREDYGITFQSNFNPAGLDDAQVFPDVESAQRKLEVIKFFRKTSVNFDELMYIIRRQLLRSTTAPQRWYPAVGPVNIEPWTAGG
jgi:alkylhydroperoxidase/carboxymuconolactone decarboxylase family protein YurZ